MTVLKKMLFSVLLLGAVGLGHWSSLAWGTSGSCKLKTPLVLPMHICDECMLDWTGARYEKCEGGIGIQPESECFLPTDVDGTVCWEQANSCGGQRRTYTDPLCQVDAPGYPWYMPYYCQRNYTTAADVDMGDTPTCPLN